MKFKKSLPYLLPSLAGLSVFYLIPLVLSLYYALINNMGSKEFIGLQNFINTVQNQMFQKGLFNTAVFMIISIPVLIVIALLIALLLERMLRGQGILMTVLMFPIIIPSGVTVHFWKSIFDINGLINKILYSLEFPIINFTSSGWAILIPIIIYLWKNTGFAAVVFYAGMKRIPMEYYEYANCTGASPWQQFYHITWTYLSPITFVVLVLSFINSFKIFKELYILYGNYPPDHLYTLQHYMNNQFFSFNMQKLTAASYILIFLVGMVIFALFYRQKRLSNAFTSLELGGHLPKTQTKRSSIISHLPAVMIALAILLPLLFTISNSIMSSHEVVNRYTTEVTAFNALDLARNGMHFVNIGFYPNNPTLEQYQNLLFDHSTYWRFYGNSIFMTLPIVLGQCIVSCLAAYAFERMQWKYKEVLFFGYIAIMMMPLQVLLVSNYLVADFLNLRDSYASIILPGIFNPLGVFWIRQNIKGFPQECIEAAELSGASEGQVFRSIVLPNLKPAVISLFVLTFADYWNVIDQAVVLIKSIHKQPLSMHLGSMLSTEPGMFFAGACLYLIPAGFVFFIGKNYLIDS
ncbi:MULTISPECIES: ABC transporter permease [unclassified Sedimentibacter]|uniref:ABC transporter permease n=1 Tax=unclassified Sedimentibacter TaxID=2649220 RepID=UPI0027E18661|nr:ABC transporter permease subunit [Sedimentibacter sp. MB35-C1]WMJ78696.1 ABC transporter permease subunit [Sedimentibacter sp. MB35-C1]